MLRFFVRNSSFFHLRNVSIVLVVVAAHTLWLATRAKQCVGHRASRRLLLVRRRALQMLKDSVDDLLAQRRRTLHLRCSSAHAVDVGQYQLCQVSQRRALLLVGALQRFAGVAVVVQQRERPRNDAVGHIKGVCAGALSARHPCASAAPLPPRPAPCASHLHFAEKARQLAPRFGVRALGQRQPAQIVVARTVAEPRR